MRSSGTRGFILLTLIILFFSPVFHHGHRTEQLVNRTVTHQVIKCTAGTACPERKTVVQRVDLGSNTRTRTRKHH